MAWAACFRGQHSPRPCSKPQFMRSTCRTPAWRLPKSQSPAVAQNKAPKERLPQVNVARPCGKLRVESRRPISQPAWVHTVRGVLTEQHVPTTTGPSPQTTPTDTARSIMCKLAPNLNLRTPATRRSAVAATVQRAGARVQTRGSPKSTPNYTWKLEHV